MNHVEIAILLLGMAAIALLLYCRRRRAHRAFR